MSSRFGCCEPVAQPQTLPLNSNRIKTAASAPGKPAKFEELFRNRNHPRPERVSPGNCAATNIPAAIPPRVLLDILSRRVHLNLKSYRTWRLSGSGRWNGAQQGVGAKRLERQLCAHARGNPPFPADPGGRPGLALKLLASPQAPARLICERTPGHLRAMTAHRFMHGVVRCGSSSGVSSPTVPSGCVSWRCLLARLTRRTGLSPYSLPR